MCKKLAYKRNNINPRKEVGRYSVKTEINETKNNINDQETNQAD